MTATLDHENAELRRANAALEQKLGDSQAQTAAITEVFELINSAHTDLNTVFDALLEKAMKLCSADFGTLAILEGNQFRTAATKGVPQAFVQYRKSNPPPYGPGTVIARILETKNLIHTVDLKEEPLYRSGDPNRRALVDLGGARTSLVVPLIRGNDVLGVIQIYRQEVRPFGEPQTLLLRNFAAQAVIAIENARLFGELRQRTTELEESLGYQTATSDVLKVISRSTFDLQPVLNTLVETATRLCAAEMGFIFRRDRDVYRLAANVGFPPAFERFTHKIALTPDRESVTGRAAAEHQAVQAVDIAADPDYAVPER